MGGGEGKRTIRLFCPSLAKIVKFEAWEDQRLDLGSIGRAFGLDPASLKLNGHFIARGLDLIASSVTWRSLLSFFSARGLSTGAIDCDPLIVDGNLSKLGSKRLHDPTESWVETPDLDYLKGSSYPSKKLMFEDADLCSNKRLKASDTGLGPSGDQINQPMKKVKQSLDNPGFQDRKDSLSGRTILNGESSCSSSNNMKRMREDNLVLAASCKKTRL